MNAKAAALLTLGLPPLFAGCASTPDATRSPGNSSVAAATGGSLAYCDDLANRFRFDHTAIMSSEAVAAGALSMGGQAIGEHCLVKGQMHPRTGVDGKPYAIAFEMRLPRAWNGRFYYQANGGLDGNVAVALGALGGGPITGALAQGFATISSDAGHTAAQTTAFGFDPQARLDYGYQAVGKLTPMAKQLVASAYGKTPDRSYIGGCSNGGRHALVAASRYPGEFDGYLAGAPGYQLPKAALANLWGSQQWAKLATAGATTQLNGRTLPDLSTALTDAERATVGRSILAQCDALDGVRDGLVQDVQACQQAFNVNAHVPTCSNARDGTCLTSAQKTTLAATHTGATTSNGTPIYNRFWFDAGITGSGWKAWKFVNSIALDLLAVGTVFRAPPAFIRESLAVSVDELAAQITATGGAFSESGIQFMTPPNATDLTAIQRRGAKVLLFHGVSDPIFSAADSADWYESVVALHGPNAADFARLFLVPGMNHCSGGPATDQFDMLAALVNWVERGVAPDAVLATARGAANAGGANPELPGDWSPTRTRLLCAYPRAARYIGNGDPEVAANFVCR